MIYMIWGSDCMMRVIWILCVFECDLVDFVVDVCIMVEEIDLN